MKNVVLIPFKYLLGLLGILLISCAPVLFSPGQSFDIRLFFQTCWQVLTALLRPAEWQLNYRVPGTFDMVDVSFSHYLTGPYLYSMPILISALLLALLLSFGLAMLFMLSKGRTKLIILQSTKVLESFPDFSYIFLIQIAVVQIYTITGYLVLDFYSLGGDLVYLAPILCLSVLPTLLFFKFFVLLFEAEWKQPYVDLARGKGLGNVEVLLKHCASNVLKSLFFQSKSIVWLTISSLLIIEHLFGIEGILYYLRSDFTPKGITFILVTVFTPFFLFYAFVELMINKKRIERNAVFGKFNLRLLDVTQLRSLISSIFRRERKGTMKFFQKLRSVLVARLKITIPFLIVLGLFFISLFYFFFYDDQVGQTQYLYAEDGSMLSSAPHPPSSDLPFGTDPYGYSIFQQLLVGIKYTIAITFIIATVRMAAGYVFGFIYVFYLNNRIRKAVTSIADGMHFLPLSLLVFMLLVPVLINHGDWTTTLPERLAIQVLIMSLIVLPITMSSIGNEMNETLKKEFVQSSVLMGGSLIWILVKHINPQLWPKLVLNWTQHVVQVLQMFVHLGILSIFVGGAASQDGAGRLIPEIYELSGMIAISREAFVTQQFWMILPPIFVFMLLIYCFNTIAEGLTQKKPVSVPVKKEKAVNAPKPVETGIARFMRLKERNDLG
ncbi:hypothetical protein [Planococcus halocryophilus]|uniref:hypothetical protein n=1 Tax=Planococcus halocryophilus TaxID=1215089 RepID=UPI001F0DD3FB|nr:hypothetical protein [Planococcus halocryophilus]MCH4826918.1 hypothetical protein [Planococcus halocryophilus]